MLIVPVVVVATPVMKNIRILTAVTAVLVVLMVSKAAPTIATVDMELAVKKAEVKVDDLPRQRLAAQEGTLHSSALAAAEVAVIWTGVGRGRAALVIRESSTLLLG
jgi:hypothetical protein